jgi:putative transposase
MTRKCHVRICRRAGGREVPRLATYLKDYATVPALETGLGSYFRFYNHERPHQSLAYRTPAEVHFA